MGLSNKASLIPINEAISYLSSNHSEKISELQARFPDISDELKPGVLAGSDETDESLPSEKDRQYVLAKAKIQSEALAYLVRDASSAAAYCKEKISIIRRLKMGSEILVLIGSSSILGTLNLESDWPTIVAAVATFLAACAALCVDHLQKIMNPELGDIFNAFVELVSLSKSADVLYREMQAALEIDMDDETIGELITRSNELMGKANQWQPQVLSL